MKRIITLLMSLLLVFTGSFSYASFTVYAEDEQETIEFQEFEEEIPAEEVTIDVSEEEDDVSQDIEVIETVLPDAQDEDVSCEEETLIEEEIETLIQELPETAEIENSNVPSEVRIWEEDNGDVFIYSSNLTWLKTLAMGETYDEEGNYINYGTVYFLRDGDSYERGVYSSSWRPFDLSEDDHLLTIPNSAMIWSSILSGDHSVRIEVLGYDDYASSEKLTLNHAMHSAPEEDSYSISCIDDEIIISGDENWLSALAQPEIYSKNSDLYPFQDGSFINIYNDDRLDVYLKNSRSYVDNELGEEKVAYTYADGKITIPASVVKENYMASGEYHFSFNAYGYEEAYTTAIIETSVKTALPSGIRVEYDKGFYIYSDNQEWLNGVVARDGNKKIELVMEYTGSDYSWNDYYEYANDQDHTVISLYDGYVFIPEENLCNYVYHSQGIDKCYLNVYSYGYGTAYVSDEFEIDLLCGQLVPEDVEIYQEDTDLIIHTEDDDYLKALDVRSVYAEDGTMSLIGGRVLISDQKVVSGNAIRKKKHVEHGLFTNTAEKQPISIDLEENKAIISVEELKADAIKEQEYNVYVMASGYQDKHEVLNFELSKDVPLAESIKILYQGSDVSGKTIYQDLNSTVTLELNVYPDKASKVVTWSSSNTKVATVNEDGVVSILNTKGTAKITAKATDGSGKSASVTINAAKLVEEITISGPSELAAGKSVTLTASVGPANASNKTVTWSSSDTSISTVTSAGKVTAKNLGEIKTVTIYATAKDNSGISAEHAITVVPAVNKVKILYEGEDYSSRTLGVELPEQSTMLQLMASTEPEDASKAVTWSSSNTKIATVNEEGVVTVLSKKGTVKITAKATDGSGKSGVITLNVAKLVKGVTISGPCEVASGKSITLKANIENTDASNKTVTWASSDTSIATVTSAGKVTAKKLTEIKTVIITATAKDGSNISDAIVVRVVPAVTDIDVMYENEVYTAKTLGVELNETESIKLEALTYPQDASKVVTWISSNTKVATVDEKGVVTFLNKKGTARITAKASDGSGKTGAVKLNVANLVKGITISGPNELAAGKSITLKADIENADASSKAITWSSSDTSVVTVSTSGKVAAKKLTEIKTATITAMARDGSGVFAEYEVKVVPAVNKVKILYEGEDYTAKTLGVELPEEGQSTTLRLETATEPEDASKSVTWSSSNTKIATVDQDGIVTVLSKKGTVKIAAKATDGSGKSGVITLNVAKLVKGITITGPNEVASGKSITLKANIENADASNKAVTWSSSNTSLATVSSSGKVTAKKVSEFEIVTITAKAKDGSGVYADYIIAIHPLATSVSILDKNHVRLLSGSVIEVRQEAGNVYQLYAQAQPEASMQVFTWTSSDKKIATVDENGLVSFTGKKGTVKITAKAADGSGKTMSVSFVHSDDADDEYVYDITFWVDNQSDAFMGLLQTQIERFNAQNPQESIKADIVYVPQIDAAVSDDVGAAADLFMFDQSGIDRLMQAAALNAVDNDYADVIRSNNDAASVEAVTYDGSIYAYPISTDNGYIMYYDKSVISQDIVDDLASLVEACEDNNKFFSFNYTSAWYNVAFFFGAGCMSRWNYDYSAEKFVSVNDTFDSDAGLIALKGMQILAKSNARNDSSSGQDFSKGSAVVVSGTWDYYTAKNILGDDLGIADLPSFTVDGQTYHPGSFSGHRLLGVKAQSDTVKATVLNKLALYLSSEQCQKERYESLSWAPSNLSVQHSDLLEDEPAIAALCAQSAYATPQRVIHDSWWSIAAELGVLAQEAENDEELSEGLKSYNEKLKNLFDHEDQYIFVGSWSGWDNTDEEYLLQKDGDILTIDIEIPESDYMGGRIVKYGEWGTDLGCKQVTIGSDLIEEYDEEDNYDNNIIFKRKGNYSLTADLSNKQIEIIKNGSEEYDVIFLADPGAIDDNGFNAYTLSGIREYCEEKDLYYTYLQPESDSDSDRMAVFEKAVEEYNASTVVAIGFLWDAALCQEIPSHPDVKVVFIDADDLYNIDYNYDGIDDSIDHQDNLAMITFAEQDCGYMAGYAAVKDGYRNLGFMGGVAVPAVIRFGYGFLEGAEDAAEDLGLAEGSICVNYTYVGSFTASDEITALADEWYDNGIQIIFSCGGNIVESIISAAKEDEEHRKIIGVDTDEYYSRATEGKECEPLFVTSAMKDVKSVVYNALKAAFEDGKAWGVYTANGLRRLGAKDDAAMLAPYRAENWISLSKEDYDAIKTKAVSVSGTLPTEEDGENGEPLDTYIYVLVNGESIPQSPQQVIFWHTFTGDTQTIIQNIIDDFNEEYEGVYVASQVSIPFADFDESVRENAGSEDGPSLVWLYPSSADEYVSKGVALDFYPYLESSEYINRVSDAVYAASTAYEGDGLYSLGLTISGSVMFYNKELLEKYDLAVPNTWQELLNACQVVVEGEKALGNEIYGFGPDSVDTLNITVMEQLGLDYVDDDDSVIDWSDQAFIEWLNWWKQAEEDGYFKLVDPESYHSGPFGNGKYLCFMGSSAGYAYISPQDFTVLTGPIPYFSEQNKYDEVSMRSLIGFKKSEKANEATARLAEYFTRS